MEFAKKVAETPPADNTNTGNTPPEGWRNPWHGAAIGGTFGGLLTTALGYLYGHRGRWLAYDALAGGLGGGTVGYAVDAHNNERAENKQEKEAIPSAYTPKGTQRRNDEKALQEIETGRQAYEEYKKILRDGGFDRSLGTSLAFWRNPWFKSWWHEGKLKRQMQPYIDSLPVTKLDDIS